MKIFDIVKEDGVYWEPNNKAGNVGTENPFGKPQQSTVKAASGQAANKNNSSDLNLDGPYYDSDDVGTENPFGQPQQSTVKAAQQTAAQRPAQQTAAQQPAQQAQRPAQQTAAQRPAQLTKPQQIQHVRNQLKTLDKKYAAQRDAYTKLLQRLTQ